MWNIDLQSRVKYKYVRNICKYIKYGYGFKFSFRSYAFQKQKRAQCTHIPSPSYIYIGFVHDRNWSLASSLVNHLRHQLKMVINTKMGNKYEIHDFYYTKFVFSFHHIYAVHKWRTFPIEVKLFCEISPSMVKNFCLHNFSFIDSSGTN